MKSIEESFVGFKRMILLNFDNGMYVVRYFDNADELHQFIADTTKKYETKVSKVELVA